MAEQPRLRVFAGPNGSGKSTMYRQVRMTKLPNGPATFQRSCRTNVRAAEFRWSQ